MNESIGFSGPAASPFVGTGGCTSGLSDHQSSLSATLPAASSGQVAPCSIHARSKPTSLAESRGPSGGIVTSSSNPATNRTSGLSAALSGKMFGA